MKVYILLVCCGLCSVAVATGRHGARRASNTMVAQIRELINEEKTLKDSLHSRIAALRQEADKLNVTMGTCVCVCVCVCSYHLTLYELRLKVLGETEIKRSVSSFYISVDIKYTTLLLSIIKVRWILIINTLIGIEQV